MKISTVEELRDNGSSLLSSKDPVLITSGGKLAGVFFPTPEDTLPLELKRELFPVLAAEMKRQLELHDLSEGDVIADFADWRKRRRETRRSR